MSQAGETSPNAPTSSVPVVQDLYAVVSKPGGHKAIKAMLPTFEVIVAVALPAVVSVVGRCVGYYSADSANRLAVRSTESAAPCQLVRLRYFIACCLDVTSRWLQDIYATVQTKGDEEGEMPAIPKRFVACARVC